MRFTIRTRAPEHSKYTSDAFLKNVGKEVPVRLPDSGEVLVNATIVEVLVLDEGEIVEITFEVNQEGLGPVSDPSKDSEPLPEFDDSDFDYGLVGRFTKRSPGPVLSRKLHLTDEHREQLNELVRKVQTYGQQGINISLYPDKSVFRMSISPMINFGEIWITY